MRLVREGAQAWGGAGAWVAEQGGPGMGGEGPGGHGIRSYRPNGTPGAGQTFEAEDGRTRFNLLGWDGHSPAPGLFPEGETS